MRMLDTFSGIGGFSLAGDWLGGIETAGFVEKDPWCRRVLGKNWPGVPQHDDIKTYKPGQFGPIDIIVGGFPCQPFSVAGKRRGEDDDRYLWPDLARIIEGERPSYVLFENVTGIINVVLDDILDDLERLGYTARAVVIPAGAVNALHRRNRLWILGYSDNNGQSSAKISGGSRSGGQDSEESISTEQSPRSGGSSRGRDGMADANGSDEADGGERANAPLQGSVGGNDRGGGDSDAGQVPDGGAREDSGDGTTVPQNSLEHYFRAISDPASQPDREVGEWVWTKSARPRHSVADAHSWRRWEHGGTDTEGESLCETQREEGSPGPRSGGENVSDAISQRPQGEQQAWPTERPALRDSRGASVVWGVDPIADGVPVGMVRPWATVPGDTRERWANGTWERGVPRIVPAGWKENDRRRKVQAAGNAIVPIVAYELLKALLAEELK